MLYLKQITMPIPALLAAAPGLIKAGASLFGAGKRKRAEAQAQERFAKSQADLQNFQFENPYANQENVFEDATVNQQQAQFEAQQADQTGAQTLDAITAGGGGGGGATALANSLLANKQQASASIGQQERQNQSASLQNQASLNQQEAQGAATLQGQQHGQIQQGFNLAQQDLSQAQAARQQATSDLVGGLAGAAGSFAGAHFDPAAVAGRQAARAAKDAPVLRMEDNPLKRLYADFMKESPLNNNGDDKKRKKKGEERRTVGDWETLEDGRQRRVTDIEQDFISPGQSYEEAGVDPAEAQAYWDANPEEYKKYKDSLSTDKRQEEEFREQERQPKSPPPGAPGGVGGPPSEQARKVQSYAWRGDKGSGFGRSSSRSLTEADLRNEARQFNAKGQTFDYDEVYDERAYGPAKLSNLQQDYIGEQGDQYNNESKNFYRRKLHKQLKAGEITQAQFKAGVAEGQAGQKQFLSDKKAIKADIAAYNKHKKSGAEGDYKWNSKFGDYYNDRTSNAYKTITNGDTKIRQGRSKASISDSGGNIGVHHGDRTNTALPRVKSPLYRMLKNKYSTMYK